MIDRLLQDAGRLLPPQIHATTLTTQEHAEKTKRIVIVGDVHGCLDEMQEILAKVNYTQESDLLLFNGDMVNKGPHSVKVCPCCAVGCSTSTVRYVRHYPQISTLLVY